MKIEMRDPKSLVAYQNNARVHGRHQLEQLVDSIKTFGFNDPIEVGEDNVIISGHARALAAVKAGLTTVPVVTLPGMDETSRKAYILAANRIAENASWDADLLKIEFETLLDGDFDVELTGFTEDEINGYLSPKGLDNVSQGTLDLASSLEKFIECPDCGHKFDVR